VLVNQTSTLLVAITNTGNWNVTIGAPAIAGIGFTLANQPALPATLAPSTTATNSVQFAPVAEGSVAGTLTITSDATGSPLNIALSGTVTAAATTAAGLLTADRALETMVVERHQP
jgi:hypothetical protein